MPGRLARKRRVGRGPAWTPGIDQFLATPPKLEHIDEPLPEAPKPSAATIRQDRQIGQAGFRYNINKRAFDAAQRYRTSAIHRYQTLMERVDRQRRLTEPKTYLKDPTKQCGVPVRDCHVLEYIVATRNDLYVEAADYVPQGYVPDLDSIHRLPRDLRPRSDGSPRVYFWG
jgi:hypothetical protein